MHFFIHIQDCINRLSAPLPPASESLLPGSDEDLTESAIALLRNGVALNVEAWQVAVDKEPDASASLKLFFQCPEVVKHRVWKQVFGATPPRGVVARLARRLGVQVPSNIGFFNYLRKADFRKEIRRIWKWYRVGRREVRSAASKRKRILRSVAARKKPRRPGRPRSVMTVKVRLHYKRLMKKNRLQGLWRWRKAALAMIAAGLDMHTGIVPVERLWSQVLNLFPSQARGISVEWFQLLANLAFLRVNFLHYNRGSLPPWCRGDSVLKHSLDGLLSLAIGVSQAGLK